MIRTVLAVTLLVAAAGAQNKDRRSGRSPERKKAETLKELSERLSRLSARTDLSAENRFLHAQVAAVQERARQAPAGSYLFDRLESAGDNLLDASEEILNAGRKPGENRESARVPTARELERTYFRVQQGDYFANQLKEPDAQELVRTARRLYQLARGAYDGGEYRRARGLAEACREVIGGLESLAQAAVPAPVPPKLPEP